MNYVYPKFQLKALDGGILSLNPGGDVVQVMFMNSSYVPSASDEFVSDINADEFAGAGYSRYTLSGKTLAVVGTNVEFAAADINDAAGPTSGTAGGYVIYVFKTNDADSILMAYSNEDADFPFDFGTNPGAPLDLENILVRWVCGSV